jgi:CRP/FNR family transcriptional regulator, cyclic AMP receptor protein
MSSLTDIFARHGQRLSVPAEAMILSRGTQASRAYMVLTGRVLLHSSSPGGREIGLEVIRPNEIFGFLSIVKNVHSVVDATALTDCELLWVEREAFDRELRTNPQFALDSLELLLKRLLTRTRQVEELALHSLRSRLARYLLSLFHENDIELVPGASLQLDLTQKHIAMMAGASRESVNRQLQKWIDANIISFTGRTLRITKPDLLVRIAGGPVTPPPF